MFFVFRYDQYYPSGGMHDCVYKSEDQTSAQIFAEELASKAPTYIGGIHILNGVTGEVEEIDIPEREGER